MVLPVTKLALAMSVEFPLTGHLCLLRSHPCPLKEVLPGNFLEAVWEAEALQEVVLLEADKHEAEGAEMSHSDLRVQCDRFVTEPDQKGSKRLE